VKIQNQITVDDLGAFHRYHLANSPGYKRHRARTRFWAFCTLLVPGMLVALVDWSYTGAAVALAYTVFITYVVLRTKRSDPREIVRKMYAEGPNRDLLAPYSLEVDKAGVVNISEFSEHRITWRAIEKVAAEERNAYLYTSSAGAIIVARASIADATWEEFLMLIRGLARANGVPVQGDHWPPEELPRIA
jgi:hypothetical protein